jgi:hypothetical protein
VELTVDSNPLEAKYWLEMVNSLTGSETISQLAAIHGHFPPCYSTVDATTTGSEERLHCQWLGVDD